MARLPMYTQQTTASPGAMTPEQAGAGTGEAMVSGGEVLADIGAGMQQREAAIRRVRQFGSFETDLLAFRNQFMASEDIASPEAREQYKMGLEELTQRYTSEYRGNMAQRAEFQNMVRNAVTQESKFFMGQQIKEQYRVAGERIETTVTQMANLTFDAPEEHLNVKTMIQDELQQFRDMFPPQQLEQMYKQSVQKIDSARIEGYLARGGMGEPGAFDKAWEILDDPNVAKNFDPSSYRKLRVGIASEQGKANQKERNRQQNIQMIQSITGRDLTPQELMRVPDEPMEAVGKINAYELVTGQRATPDVVRKFMGASLPSSEGGAFGNSESGRAKNIVLQNYQRYADGSLDPQGTAEFEMALATLQEGKPRFDPVTGTVINVAGEIPGFVQQAVTERRMRMGGGSPASQSAPVPDPTVTAPPAPPQAEQLSSAPEFVQPETAADARGPFMAQGGGEPAPQQRVNLWGMADDVAGPVAGVQRMIGGGPIDVGIGQRQVAAAQQVDMQQRNLVRALQQNPRYAEGERKSIAEDIKIEPSILSNPTAYRTRLVEIGRYIQEELQHNANVLSKPQNSTVQQRQQALQSIAALEQFYGALGLPPQVGSVEEAKKLPPGTMFLDNNWTLRQVPQ